MAAHLAAAQIADAFDRLLDPDVRVGPGRNAEKRDPGLFPTDLIEPLRDTRTANLGRRLAERVDERAWLGEIRGDVSGRGKQEVGLAEPQHAELFPYREYFVAAEVLDLDFVLASGIDDANEFPVGSAIVRLQRPRPQDVEDHPLAGGLRARRAGPEC